jgi:Domain of unknown function (DUF4158)
MYQNSRSLLGCRDLAAVRQHRGDHNRLGFAVRFCYPRYPGRVLANACSILRLIDPGFRDQNINAHHLDTKSP